MLNPLPKRPANSQFWVFMPTHRRDFDEDDVESNRDGLLSQRQRWRLQRSRLQYITSSLFFAAIPTVFILMGFHFWGWMAWVMWLMFGLGTLFAALGWRRYTRDLTDTEVERVEGPIRIQLPVASFGHIASVLDINGRKFTIASDLMLQLKDGTHYAAYVARNTGMLLSIEELPDNDVPQKMKVKAKRDYRLVDDGEVEFLDIEAEEKAKRGQSV
ncbi:MAG: hypothetical protein OHK0023_06290 [Anaerolineae bacterium]